MIRDLHTFPPDHPHIFPQAGWGFPQSYPQEFPMTASTAEPRSLILSVMKERILVLDGGLGTLIQNEGLDEVDYRGERFSSHPVSLKGNHDVLVLTRPEVISSVHERYIEAGADIIETCTFSSNAVSQAEYGLVEYVKELNRGAVRLARNAAERVGSRMGRRVFVAGSVGPTSLSLSMQSDASATPKRFVSFDELRAAYEAQISVLIEEGVDLILIETIFDVLNAKAASVAVRDAIVKAHRTVPVIFSVTLADHQGRLLSGQTLEAFVASIEPLEPLAISLNCGFGVTELRRFMPHLSGLTSLPVGCYPNAGLPDEEGRYYDTGEFMAEQLAEFARHGWLNFVGGCCGTTPEHIRAIARRLKGIAPRPFEMRRATVTRFAGLESLVQREGHRIVIAERSNVAGSKKFKRLIENAAWDEALDIARDQMRAGADMIDICMDAPLLDAVSAMTTFLRKITQEPEISKFPLVIDSSNFEVVEAALKEVPGRCLVNSISLKGGETEFLEHARTIQKYGAAVVVMAFDEQGQASTTPDRVRILSRAIELLTTKLNFALCDIVVDPNILAIGTGLPEHDIQAVSFIESCIELKKRYPGVQTSGGLSNLSFSFRGRNDVREAIHAAFLQKAKDALTMVISNPSLSCRPEDISPELLKLAGDLVAARPGALDALIAWTERNAMAEKTAAAPDVVETMSHCERLVYAMTRGVSRYLERDMASLSETMSALQIIEGPLMDAMNIVGERFGRGEMFLPQIVKAAHIMKQAISYLDIQSDASRTASRKRILMATVWGDVHDIGKNIVDIVLTCNGYEVVDLGVMVPTEKIVSEAERLKVDAIGLSGLISPSLRVMQEVARALREAGLTIPLFVGGAATSDEFAALKLVPAYEPGVVTHITDASRVPCVLGPWLNPETKNDAVAAIQAHHAEIQNARRPQKTYLSLEEARRLRPGHAFVCNEALETASCERQRYSWNASELEPHLTWAPVCRALRVAPPHDSEAVRKLDVQIKSDAALIFRASDLYRTLISKAFFQLVPASSHDEVITVYPNTDKAFEIHLPRLLDVDKPHHSLADFLPPGREARIGLFALTCPIDQTKLSAIANYTHLDRDYVKLVTEITATALVSAANDVLHDALEKRFGHLVRPAIGYPVVPDHALKKPILSVLRANELGMTLTPNYMMDPVASICGFTIFHPEARLFDPGLPDA